MNKQVPKLTTGRVIQQGCVSLCCYSAFIIAIAVILSASSINCSNPIREWLITWVVVGSTSFLILFISNLIAVKHPESAWVKCSKLLMLLIFLFNVSWVIVGSVWLYTSDFCKDVNYDMWALTLAILIISYVGIGICCCGICCFCICMGTGVGLMMKLKKAEQAAKNKNPASGDQNHHESAELEVVAVNNPSARDPEIIDEQHTHTHHHRHHHHKHHEENDGAGERNEEE